MPDRLQVQESERALRLAVQRLGWAHLCEEGPNAGWRDTNIAEGDLGWYDDDLVCRADCPVCEAIQACQEALDAS